MKNKKNPKRRVQCLNIVYAGSIIHVFFFNELQRYKVLFLWRMIHILLCREYLKKVNNLSWSCVQLTEIHITRFLLSCCFWWNPVVTFAFVHLKLVLQPLQCLTTSSPNMLMNSECICLCFNTGMTELLSWEYLLPAHIICVYHAPFKLVQQGKNWKGNTEIELNP